MTSGNVSELGSDAVGGVMTVWPVDASPVDGMDGTDEGAGRVVAIALVRAREICPMRPQISAVA